MRELQIIDNADVIVSAFKTALRNGDVDAREYARLLQFEKKLSTITKDKKIRDIALEEFSKYPEKEGEYKGVKWTYKNGSGRYGYEHSEEWQKLKEQEEKMGELRKQLEEKMKAAYKTNSTIVDDETGEVIPPATYTAYSDSISVK